MRSEGRSSWPVVLFIAGLALGFLAGLWAGNALVVEPFCGRFCAARGSTLQRILPGRTRYDRDRPMSDTCACADGSRRAVDGMEGFAPTSLGLLGSALAAVIGVLIVRRSG